MAVPKRGHIIHLTLSPTAGKEIQDGAGGGRYALVLSTLEFNRQSGLLLIAPITQGVGLDDRQSGFMVPLMGSGSGVQGVVLCDQVRTVDAKARKFQIKEMASSTVITESLAAVSSLLEE